MDGQLRRASETEAERKEAAQGGLRSSAHFRVGWASMGLTVAGRLERARVYSHSSPGHLRSARPFPERRPAKFRRAASIFGPKSPTRANGQMGKGRGYCSGLPGPPETEASASTPRRDA
jgi:hypothetical protein